MKMRVCAAVLLGAVALGAGQPESMLDPELPRYEKTTPVAGDLRTVGSDTMVNLVSLWTQAFKKQHPAARIQVEAKGSSTGPPALIEGQAQFAPMSRAMEPEEIALFEEKFGYKPTQLRVAIDCIAVFVNKDCPLEELSLSEVAQVFSVDGPTMTWGDLGVEETGWRDRPISLYGRNSASGTYKFFKDVACSKADYKASVKEAPGSAGVVQGVAKDPYAMGYSGIGFKTPDVKALKLSFGPGDEAFEPGLEHALTGDYPLARFLYMYTNYDRRHGLDALRAEFLRFVFSRDGQEAVVKDGAYPLPASIAEEEMQKVGL
ncbi:MAG: PstS family phosphate ABC transporter substrate-binding protein [Phycisphaerales bacterium]